MKRQIVSGFTALWLATFTAALMAAAGAPAGPQAMPFVFEKNAGQGDRQVRYFGRAQGAGLWLVDSGAVLSVERPHKNQRAVLRMKLEGARPHPQIDGTELLPGKTNYFTGNDPTQWRKDIAQYAAVRYQAPYPGVDLVFHASGQTIEYDWIVSPGADPRQIRMSFQGASEFHIDSSGDLVLRIGDAEVREKRPHVFQEGREIEGHFVRRGRAIGFEVAHYDRSRTLTIDPVLTYATYFGGSGNTAEQFGDYAYAVAVDAQGNAIVAGITYSTNFPNKSGLYDTNEPAASNAFIAKLNPAGSGAASLIWSTYLGATASTGENIATGAVGVAVDPQGNVYVTGLTYAPNFPLMNPFEKTPAALCSSSGAAVMCEQAYVTKISSAGNQLVYSSYLGGADSANLGMAIAVNSAGNAWIAGDTVAKHFPVAGNYVQNTLTGAQNGFVSMVSADGSQLVYSTYIGGENTDVLNAIAVDNAGNAYVAGASNSYSYPVVNAYLTTLPVPGVTGGVVSNINPNLSSSLVYSTYLGGTAGFTELWGITTDTKGNIFVTGVTEATNFPLTANTLQQGGALGIEGQNSGAIIVELNPATQPAAQLEYSSYLAGGYYDVANAIGVDSTGRILLTGYTESPKFPTTPDAFQSVYSGDVTNGVSTAKAFFSIVDPTTAGLKGLVYSTLYGGSQDDTAHGMALNATATTATIVGDATSPDLFVTPSAFQPALNSPYGNAFIATFNLTQSGPVVTAMTNAASFAAGTTFAPGEIVTLFGTSLGPQTLAGDELDPTTGLLASTLAGCQFLVNGTPAPLVYVQALQVSAILPYELTPNVGTSQVNYGQMVCNSVPGNVFEFSVVGANPGVFAASGTTQAAVLNADGSYNSASNPAALGSLITVFETGEGVLTPAGQDGHIETGALSTIPAPSLPVSVTIGGIASPMLTYAKVAPGEVDGLLQIDAQVPSGVAAGNVPIVVNIGKFSSQSGLTIAVQ